MIQFLNNTQIINSTPPLEPLAACPIASLLTIYGITGLVAWGTTTVAPNFPAHRLSRVRIGSRTHHHHSLRSMIGISFSAAQQSKIQRSRVDDANGSIRKALRQSVERAGWVSVSAHLAPSAVVRVRCVSEGVVVCGWHGKQRRRSFWTFRVFGFSYRDSPRRRRTNRETRFDGWKRRSAK